MFAHWPRPLFFFTIIAVLGVDQLSKAWILASIPWHHSLTLIPGFFDLTYSRNTGVAFGMFQGRGLLVALAVVAVALVAYFATRGIDWAGYSSNLIGGGIVGGAMGNLIDRARLGYVVDFFNFHWQEYHWFIFNVADSAICLSVACLVFLQLRATK